MRKITIRLDGVDDDQYADIVNAIRMQMKAIDCDFTVTPDGQAVPAQLDKRWDEYSQVSWEKAVDAAPRRQSRPARTGLARGTAAPIRTSDEASGRRQAVR